MKTTILPAPITCACSSIRSTNRAVTQLYDLALAPTGMKATQFMILQIIADAGEIAQCDFARQYSISVETLSRRFSWLRRKGLVAIRMGKRSEIIYNLTQEGVTALLAGMLYWEGAETRSGKSSAKKIGRSSTGFAIKACMRFARPNN